MVPFHPLARSTDIFSDFYCENLFELLEVQLTKISCSLYDWVPLELLTHILVHTEPLQQFVNYNSGFLSEYSFPWCFHFLVSSLQGLDSMYLPVCLYSLGGSSLPCVLSSHRSKKSLFFSLFNILLVTSVALLTSLHHVESRNQKPSLFFSFNKELD